MSSASHKAKLFHEKICENSNLDDSGISLPVFPARTNLKLHNISVTHRKSGPDCIPVVVLKNYELELSYILAELFNKLSDGVLFSRLFEGFISGLRI